MADGTMAAASAESEGVPTPRRPMPGGDGRVLFLILPQRRPEQSEVVPEGSPAAGFICTDGSAGRRPQAGERQRTSVWRTHPAASSTTGFYGLPSGDKRPHLDPFCAQKDKEKQRLRGFSGKRQLEGKEGFFGSVTLILRPFGAKDGKALFLRGAIRKYHQKFMNHSRNAVFVANTL